MAKPREPKSLGRLFRRTGGGAGTGTRARKRMQVETIEPRVLHSAELLPTAFADVVATQVEMRLVEAPPVAGQAVQVQQRTQTELVFVDAGVDDYETLVADIRASRADRPVDVIVLDGARDGIEQIGQALAGREAIAAVHIISHGSDGRVLVGSGAIDLQTLAARRDEVAAWRNALSDNADLLIYGCNVAETAAGRAFIDELAVLTGADVAGSDDRTGVAAAGGDWHFEHTTGSIEAELIISRAAQLTWSGVLAIANVSASKDTYIVSATGDNYGASTQLVLDTSGGGLGDQRILLQFDLSGIPAGATLNSATLQMQATAAGTAMNIDVHEVLESWNEGTGNGAADAANWNERSAGTTWSTAGGAYDATAAATINTAATGQHSWTLTTLVQAWLNGTKTNNGIMVGSPDLGSATVVYDSREGGTAPRLVIDYTPANSAPTFTSATTATVYENSTAVQTLAATDADGDAIVYSIVGGDDAALFSISGSTGLVFQSARNFESPADVGADNVYDVRVRASDGRGGTTEQSIAVTVSNVNEAPSGTTATLTMSQDTSLTLGGSHFGFTDTSDTPANNLSAVRIVTLPGAGSLTLNGGGVSAGQTISAADLNAGNLVYTPVAGTTGSGYASFTFQVQDDGGTANGGINLDPTARTLTIDVTAVAPAGEAIRETYDVPLSGVGPHEVKSDQVWGQSFAYNSPYSSYLVDKIGLVLWRDATAVSQTITVSLRSSMGGAVIASGTISSAALSTTKGWTSVDLATHATLSDNTTYYIHVTSDTTAGKIYLGVDDTGSYTSGALVNASGAVQTGKDALFRIIDRINTAPVLAGGNNLQTINEDAVSNGGTLVSTLIAGQVTDADAGSLAGIAVTAIDNTNGTWQYTTNGGSSWSAFGAVSGGTARLLAADANTSIRFVPNANWHGTVGAGLTFRAWDQTSGSNGGTADTGNFTYTYRDNFSTAAYSNNDGNNQWSGSWVDSGGSATGGQIQVSGNRLYFDGGTSSTSTIYREVNLAGASSATLTFDYTNSVSPGTFSLQISSNGGSSYTTLANSWSSSGTATFNIAAYAAANTRIRFVVQGDGGLLGIGAGGPFTVDNLQISQVQPFSGGTTAHSTATASVGITVSPVNDAPTGVASSVTTLEETGFTFTAAHFAISDTADTPANAFAGVRIATLPSAGALTLNGAAVTAGDVVSLASLNAGHLIYTPATNGQGTGYASFTFQVQDDGGTANGGANLDTVARTMTIDVTNVNDAPVLTGANPLANINEDAATNGGTLVSALISSRVNEFDPSALSGIAVVAVDNTHGNWQYSTDGGTNWSGFGSVSAAHARLLAADANTFVRFVPSAANWHGTVSNGLTFRAWDQTLGSNGGTAPTIPNPTLRDTFAGVSYSGQDGTARWTTNWVDGDNNASSGSVSISGGVLEIRTKNNTDSPVYRQADLSYATGATLSFSYTNPLTLGDGGSIVVEVSGNGGGSYTTVGTFSDVSNTGSGTFTADISGQIAANTRIQFRLVTNSGPTRTFTVDNVQIAYTTPGNGGASAFSTATASTGITVDSVNDAPAGANTTVTTLEDTAFTFTAAHFALTDVNDSPANALAAVRVSTLPGAGTLRLNGVAVTAGQSVSVADINAGRLVYTPAANAHGAGYTSFTFQVQDDGGTDRGGVNLDGSANSMTINVTSVNDAPGGANKTTTILEDSPYILTVADFGFSDAGDSPANAFTAVTVSALPGAGTLRLSGIAVTVGQSISVADVTAGNLIFTPATNANGTGYASFSFRVQDDGGTSNSGVDLDPTANTITFDVTSVNDAPVGSGSTITTLEDTSFTLTTAHFGFSDTADSPANTFHAVTISSLPTGGSLRLNSTAVTAGQSILASDIAAGRLVYAPGLNGNGAGHGNFTFRVQDTGGIANGGVDLDVTARTMTINVTAVPDAPVLTGANNLSSILEDAATNTGTLVSALLAGHVTDGDAGALAGIAVTAVDNSSGTWQYSTNGGSSWSGLAGVSDYAARLLGADANTRVRFVPGSAHWNGTVANGITFRAWDQTSGTNGGTAATVVDRTVRDNFSSTSYSNQNGTASWTSNWTDVDGSAGGGDTHVDNGDLEIYTRGNSDAPVWRELDLSNAISATLTLTVKNPLTVFSGGSIALEISADGGGSYTTLGTFSGFANPTGAYFADISAYASSNTRVQFRVASDSGTTRTFGVDDIEIAYTERLYGGTSAFSSTTASAGITVTSVNDAPQGSGTTLTTLEDTPLTFTLANFALTDGNDSPANALAGVRFDSLPGAGTLTLSGVAVTAGQIVSAGDISAGRLVFTPGLNAHGTSYASFTFRVQDDGGTANGGVNLDATARTLTVNVTSVNDAPSGTDTLVTTLEDTSFTFTAAHFGYSDSSDSPANSFSSVRITTLPSAGTLSLNGVAVAAGQTVSVSNINSGLLVFTPVANANGAAYASFTFQVQDSGGTANGGINRDATPNAITIDVTSVNDAPSGTNRTVSTLEDTAYALALADFGFADAADSPANAFTGVTIGSVPAAGSLTLNGVAVSGGQTIAAADIAAGQLVFAPATHAHGTAYASFTFRVEDDGGTANGGATTDASANTISFNVISVNDPPSGTGATVSTNEDTPLTLTLTSFGFSDSADLPANAFASVRINSLSGAGSLTLNNVAVTAGQVISAADIAAGRLVFTAAANAHGNNYAAFTFQVGDDGGTANGGADLDPVSRTLTVDVTSVNDAPSGTDTAVTTLEDTAFTFTAAHFGYSDAADSPANTFSAVTIGSLPTLGALTLNGVAVTAGQSVAVTDIVAGQLVYQPGAHGNGAAYASFTFRVRDDGGTANGGVDLDATANTLTIDVTSVNDAPTGTNTTVSTLEDAPYTFALADFGYADAADAPSNAFASVTIASVPGTGALTLAGVGVTAGQVISAADITSGQLVFAPVANAHGASYASFTFRVGDDGGTANGGFDVDTTARTLSIDVVSVNDAPDATNNTVGTREDTPYAFTVADFQFREVIDAPANALAGVRLTTLPPSGALTLNGVAVTAGQIVGVADIVAGRLIFTPGANAHGNAYASFEYQVQDDGGTANGGVNLDPTSSTMTIDVSSVSDAPVSTDATVTMDENTSFTFTLAQFAFADAADSPSHAYTGLIVSSLPTAGTLTLNGAAVTVGQTIAVADIAAGQLVFTSAFNASGTPYSSFTFQVQDDGGTGNGGLDTDPTANTVTINVIDLNHAPSGADSTVTINEDEPLALTAAHFGYSDSDLPTDAFASVRINTLSGAGVLALNGVAVTAGQVVSAADVAAGRLVFTPSANAHGSGYAAFTFQVQDDGGTVNGGVDLDPIARTLAIDVRSVNDAPTGSDITVSMLEDTAFTFTVAHFGYSDTADTPSNTFSAVTIASLPTAGTLTLNGVAVTAGQSIAVADIAAGQLVYQPASNGQGVAYASFGFRVADDGGTANGGVDLDVSANTVTIDVTNVNDAPGGTNTTVTINEDTPLTLTAAHFGFVDPEDAPANALASVRINTVSGAGSLTLNGAAVTSGQVTSAADIAAGRLVFSSAANAHGSNYASFTFQVADDGGVANGGTNLDATENTLTVTVRSVNDAPAGTDNTVTTNEDMPLTFTAAHFGFSDPSDSPANNLASVRVTTVPTVGALRLNGVTVTAGQVVSVSNLNAGLLVFTPAADANGSGYASFTFQVQDGGGTSNGGVNRDPTPNTMRIDVTSVNDAPSGSDRTVNTLEDTDYVFALADFGFSDAGDSPSNAFSTLTISSVPVAGSLLLNGVAVTAGQSVAAADIAAGRLVFKPAANAHGAAYASFTFHVGDDGGTSDGGVNLDGSPNTLTIDVTSVNDAPTGADLIATLYEDTAYIFSVVDFGFSDPSDAPANTFSAVVIAALPAQGSLTLNGAAVTAGQTISVASITAGRLVYTPPADAHGAAYANIGFRVQDSGGGSDTDALPRTLRLDVLAVNDAPVLSGGNDLAATPEDATTHAGTLVSALLAGRVSDVDGGAPTGIAVVGVDNRFGEWQFTTNGGSSWSAFGAPSANAARLLAGDALTSVRFVPNANWHGTIANGITYRAWDGTSGTAGGMSSTGQGPTSVVDDFSSGVYGGNAGASRWIGAWTDPDRNPHAGAVQVIGGELVLTTFSGSTSAYRDVDLTGATGATLSFDYRNTLGAAGAVLLQISRDGGSTFTTVDGFSNSINAAASATYSHDLSAHVGGQLRLRLAMVGVATGGALSVDNVRLTYDRPLTGNEGALSANTASSGITVLSVNDAPVGADATVSTAHGAAYTFGSGVFAFSDPRDTPANAFAGIRISALPLSGSLRIDGIAATVGQTVSAADLATGKLIYAPGLGHGSNYSSLGFQVLDDGGGSNADPIARTVTFNVGAPPPVIIIAPEPVVAAPAPAPAPAADNRPNTSSSTSGSSSGTSASGSTSSGSSSSSSSATGTTGATGATSGASGSGSGSGSASDSGGLGPSAGDLAVTGGSGAPEGAGPNRNASAQDDGRITNSAVTVPNANAQGQLNVQRLDSVQLLKDARDGLAVGFGDGQSLLQLQSDGIALNSVVLGGSVQTASGSMSAETAEGRAFMQELEQVRDGLKDQTRFEAATVAVSAATGMSLSVGYVVWLLRGGALLSTFLSSLPAWRLIDPLPVLGRVDEDGELEEDDSLETLVTKNDTPTDDTPAADMAQAADVAVPEVRAHAPAADHRDSA